MFTFEDNSVLTITDEGQSCCESRYMSTDDELPYYIGAMLMDISEAEGPGECGEHGNIHEIVFVKITTTKGVFTVVNHNEHNGYYGGFSISATYKEAVQ